MVPGPTGDGNPGMMFVPPWMMNWMGGQQQSPQISGPNFQLLPNEVPARVQAAIKYLMDLSIKTCPILLPKEESIGGGHELHEGQKLEECEETAQQAACQLLTNYFTGHVGCDQWESTRLRGACANLEGATSPPPGGKAMACPKCSQYGRQKNCEWCAGTGHILIYAAMRVPGAGQGSPEGL